MVTVELILRDDNGRIINEGEKRVYKLNPGNRSFHEIEGEVEGFKKEALPDIEVDLLKEAQTKFIEEAKKKGS